MEGIASRIERVIQEKSLSQRDFSKIVGFTPGYINDILRGRTTPSIRVVERMTKALDVSADWLLSGEELMYDEKRGKSWPEVIEVVTSKSLLIRKDKYGKRKYDFVAVPVFNNGMLSKLPRKVADITSFVPDEYCIVPHMWVKRPRTTFCYHVNGKSMEPSVPHGSVVATDCSVRTPSRLDGKLCLIIWKSMPMIRRLRVNKTHLVFEAEGYSSDSEPIRVEIGDKRPIVGRVEWTYHIHK